MVVHGANPFLFYSGVHGVLSFNYNVIMIKRFSYHQLIEMKIELKLHNWLQPKVQTLFPSPLFSLFSSEQCGIEIN